MLKLPSHLATQTPKRVLAASVVILVVCIALGSMSIGQLQNNGFDDPNADSVLAADEIAERFGGSPDLVFLVTAKKGSVDAPPVDQLGIELTENWPSIPGSIRFSRIGLLSCFTQERKW